MTLFISLLIHKCIEVTNHVEKKLELELGVQRRPTSQQIQFKKTGNGNTYDPYLLDDDAVRFAVGCIDYSMLKVNYLRAILMFRT